MGDFVFFQADMHLLDSPNSMLILRMFHSIIMISRGNNFKILNISHEIH